MRPILLLCACLCLAMPALAQDEAPAAPEPAPAPAAAPAPAPAPRATVVVTMTDFRSDKGRALLALYRGGEGFPGSAESAVATGRVDISGAKATHVFKDLEPGDYAISVIHDEDGDGALKTNFLGIPTEGVGTSNNPRPRMGPPRYKDARFEVGTEDLTQSIKITYVF